VRLRWRALVADVAVVAACAGAVWGFGCEIVSGGSMRPALSPGDVVVYRRAPVAVSTGEVVLLGGRGHEFVHRVVAIGRDGMLVTRGDANAIADFEPTSTSSVRGRVVGVLPLGRLVEHLASSDARARLWSQSHTQR
jgi:signal peptidase I